LGEVVPREVRSSARRVRSRPPPLTPADGHHRCFWLRHRPKRAPWPMHSPLSSVREQACPRSGFAVRTPSCGCRVAETCRARLRAENTGARALPLLRSNSQHLILKFHGPPNSGRSAAEWAPSYLKRATDACVLASNNASPAQRGPRTQGCSTAQRHAPCSYPANSTNVSVRVVWYC